MNIEVMEARLAFFYQLMQTDSKGAEEFYNHMIYPLIQRAVRNGDADYIYQVSELVKKQLSKN
jgi:hypothetical protein